jgi:hypothetical protein
MQITTCQFNDSYFPIMDGVSMTEIDLPPLGGHCR